MKLVKITAYATKGLKYDKNGNAIIKLPTGSPRIVIQGEKEAGVEDIQFKTLLTEIRSVGTKVDKNTKAIKDVDAKLDKHIIEGH